MWYSSLSELVLSTLSSLDALSWYSLVGGSVIVAWILSYGFKRAFNSGWRQSLTSSLLRHLVYPHLFNRIPFLGTPTRLEALFVFSYLLANSLLVTLGVKAEIGSRAGIMSIINLIPLLCGSRLSVATRLLGISPRTSVVIHQWLGRTTTAQILVHSTLVLARNAPLALTTRNLAGVVASSSLGLMFLLSISFVRERLYEWFLNSHTLFAAVVLTAIWYHVSPKQPATLFLRIGVCLWTVTTVAQWGLFTFRNVVRGKPSARAFAWRLSDSGTSSPSLIEPLNILKVDVTVTRPWPVKGGQFIFLSIPRLGVFTGLRGHPFMISWWERDQNGLTVSLLMKPRAGFTAELGRHTNKSLVAFVDGPYGANHNFGDFETIIMIATGIGIAGHMPYIKDLIRGYNNCEVKTSRIRLEWVIDQLCHELWVKPWMDELVASDTGYIFEVMIHVKEGMLRDEERARYSRIKKTSAPLDISDILRRELEMRKGRVMVSVSADQAIAERARSEVSRRKNARFVELDFQPPPGGSIRLPSADMEFMCRG